MTDRQRLILKALLERERSNGARFLGSAAMTGNEIGYALGFRTGQLHPGQTNHRGQVMGPAQRVIGSLNGLSLRGLVQLGARTDGLSGSAYMLTDYGRREAERA